MIRARNKRIALAALALTVALSIMLTPASRIDAADHGDAPLTAHDQGCDINDVYLFLDPNDNSKVILAFDVHGFIVPGFLRGRILSRKARWISRFHSANLRSSCAFPARKLWSQTHSQAATNSKPVRSRKFGPVTASICSNT